MIQEAFPNGMLKDEPIPDDVGGFQTVQGITLVESPVWCERIDWNGGRWYGMVAPKDQKWAWKDRGWKPSSTTILDQALPKGIGFTIAATKYPDWGHAREAWDGLAYDGTMVHALIKQMILGVEVKVENGWFDPDLLKVVPIEKRHVRRLQGFERFWKDLKPQVSATEILLYNDETPWAGTADLICEINGVRWLLDIKTGKEYEDSHQRQLISYGILWDTMFPDFPIDKIGCLYLPEGWRKEEKSYKLKEYEYSLETWERTFDLWEDLNPGLPPEPKELPTVFSLKEAEDAEIGN